MTEQQIRIKELVEKDVDDDIVLEMQPINTIQTELEEIGFEMEDLDDNTNGWEIDFFYYFNHITFGRYLLQGSLWYGNFKFGKADE